MKLSLFCEAAMLLAKTKTNAIDRSWCFRKFWTLEEVGDDFTKNGTWSAKMYLKSLIL